MRKFSRLHIFPAASKKVTHKAGSLPGEFVRCLACWSRAYAQPLAKACADLSFFFFLLSHWC